MDVLPDEILVLIFEALDWKDRLSADAVSARWSALMPFKATELDLLAAVFGEPTRRMDTFPLTDEVVRLISRSGSHLVRVCFGHHNLLVPPVSIDLLEKHCPNLAHLDLSFCTVTERIVQAIIRLAQRLKSLNLSNTFFSVVNKDSHRMNMCVLFSSMINLEELNLSNTNCENFCAVPYLSPTIKSANFNACSPMRPAILVEFLLRSHALEALHLSTYISLDDTSLDCICSLRGLRVFEWSYVTFGQLIGHGGHWLVDLQKLSKLHNLTELHLQHNHQIVDEEFESICQQCSKLEVLNVSYCRNLTSFAPLLKLRRLCRLYVAAAPCFTDSLLAQIAAKGKLLVLHATVCPLTEAIADSLACCNALENVDLSFCEDVDDSVLLKLARHCAKLEKLALQGCRITDFGLLALEEVEEGNNCFAMLKHLDISFCVGVSDIGLSVLCRLIGQNNSANRKQSHDTVVQMFCHQTKCTKATVEDIDRRFRNIRLQLS